MTIFEKLNEARLRFQNAGVKKTGNNKFAGYTYYELADILPEINKLANELKFCCVVNFTPDLATLDFCDLEKDEKIQEALMARIMDEISENVEPVRDDRR